ncbi:MAG: hypothetical protein JWL75_247 [Parcubacteria group bacterium]|nr:hypothetical protein [Parcubacteria group bacterium]
MKDSQWYFGAAVVVVLVLGVIFLLIHSHKDTIPAEAPSAVETLPVQTTGSQGTSSGVINPNAIPE